ncbi:GerMN domain-containing protein [Bacillus piscicola]|uniref:GerMN domain-containing protein n=1 Tax=Bacillus piscicola TaxID=1632684 RepID=UPI001F09B750|nr:GerMN domain-containing protein [Bacillus piscicola]
MKKNSLIGAAAFLMILFLLQGCGFSGEDASEKMDAPPEEGISEVEWEPLDGEGDSQQENKEKGNDAGEADEKAAENTVERELYLINEDGLVVPHTFSLPKDKAVLKQSLEYLVADGPLTQMLPNGFQAVLPPGTEIDVHLTEEGTAIADFSPEFRDYDPKHEQAILEAVTWTLTQFENVNEVEIQINGYEQETMPANNTPIGKAYSRANGINLESGNVSDMTNSDSVTVYFLSQTENDTYFVPVTRRVNNEKEKEPLDAAVEELIKGPAADSPLHGVFREGAALHDAASIKDETASLVFNEAILTEKEGTAVAEDVVHAVTLTATEVSGVENVSLSVNGLEDALEVSGNPIDKPLVRPASVNPE